MTQPVHLPVLLTLWLSAVLMLALGACPAPSDDDDSAGDDDDATSDDDDDSAESLEIPDTYAFDSRFEDGESSISYSGQVGRQVLLEDISGHIGGMTGRLNAGWYPVEDEVLAELNFYYEFDGETSGDIEHGISTTPSTLQTTYGDISSGKSLKGKLAGNDPDGQHKDWSTEFAGWGATGSTTPEGLLLTWFEMLDAQALDWNTTQPTAPSGNPVSSVYQTSAGHDLKQLIQKYLSCSVAFSQGADDYMDDDFDGKGLLADNTEAAAPGEPYSDLEHAWDEGFGYFGAARDYADYTDIELADSSLHYSDTDGDGALDLLSEWNTGHSVNAGKRDKGSADGPAPTDMTQQAWDGFVTGRAIIASADGALSDAQLADLQAQRDLAIAAWEAAVMATVVHYINDTLGDMADFGGPDYSFDDHSKHWSEAKGFAFCPQFNPRSPMTAAQFEELHALLGDAPALPGAANVDAYADGLIEARTLIGEAYDFDPANVESW